MSKKKKPQKRPSRKTEGSWARVFVEWLDSCKFKQPWWSFEEFRESSEKHSIMTSVGYLFHEDKYFIYLATSLHWEEGVEVVQFGNITSIPKAAITKKETI